MTTTPPPLAGLRHRLLRLPIFNRVLLGNSLVIIAGAIGGTLVTRQLARQQELWLIALFASLGILLSLVVNYWIIRSALRPLRELCPMVEPVQAGRGAASLPPIHDADPDTQRLAAAIQSMLTRLEVHTRQLHALSQRAINAQEDERKRIAQDLHDDTAQALSTLIISPDRLEASLPAQSGGLLAQLHAARELTTRAGGLAQADLRPAPVEARRPGAGAGHALVRPGQPGGGRRRGSVERPR
ncbi:MAG: histidine kinase [Chloroflexota bacterium]